MKKTVSIRALLIALMLIFTFTIPALVSANTMAAPVEVVEATAIEAPTVSAPIDVSKIIPDTTALVDEISTAKDEINYTVQEVIEEMTEVKIEEVPSSFCDYCGSEDHSFAYCVQHSIDNGAVGRWIIPNVGINVACYPARGYTAEELAYQQAVVDAADSASIVETNAFDFIGDHSNQSFSALKYVNVGDEAYMDYGSYQQKYVCTKFVYGHNYNGRLTDADCIEIEDYSFNDGGITCYTCNGCSQNIILVCFQPVYD